MADESKAETITIPKAQYNKLSQRASQRAWWEAQYKKLRARLEEEEGGELPSGPDLVTLHATLAIRLYRDLPVAKRCTKDAGDASQRAAGAFIKSAIAFDESVRAGEHSPDAGDMAESEMSADELLRRMNYEVARGGETGA